MRKMSPVSRSIKTFRGNFTIEHILNVAGERHGQQDGFNAAEKKNTFEWLTCTRYKPPKLPRQRKKEGVQRRKLARSPRIPFSRSQVAFLEKKFTESPYLSSKEVTALSNCLKLTETRVKIWFQNRRAREKKENSRDSITKSKSHDLPEYAVCANGIKLWPTGTASSEPEGGAPLDLTGKGRENARNCEHQRPEIFIFELPFPCVRSGDFVSNSP